MSKELLHAWTSSKLKGAEYHLRRMKELREGGGVPEEFWYEVEAFFGKLLSAWDCLLQEVNLAFNLELPIDEVKWGKVQNKLRERGESAVLDFLKQKWEEERFKKLRKYHNFYKHVGPVPSNISLAIEEVLTASVSVEVLDQSGKVVERRSSEPEIEMPRTPKPPSVSCHLPKDPYKAWEALRKGITPEFEGEEIISYCEKSLGYLRELIVEAQRLIPA